MNAKKLGIGFVVALFAVVLCMPFSGAWADVGMSAGNGDNWVLRAANRVESSLYDGGMVRGVLTSHQPTPWRWVQYYVGNRPSALIAKILVEQGISLDQNVKYPPGTIVTVPQKYVLKALLPSPSAAEVAILEAEHRAILKEQAELFRAELRSKDNGIIGHWLFHILSAVIIGVLAVSRKRWHEEYVGADATADVYGLAVEDLRRQNKGLNQALADIEKRYQDDQKLLDTIVSGQVGQVVFVSDNSGLRHGCLIKRHEWSLENKVTVVWLECAYCDSEVMEKYILGHISKQHPEKMSPDPKGGSKMGPSIPYGAPVEKTDKVAGKPEIVQGHPLDRV